MAYHRHPEGQSHVRTPHLHLGPGAEIGRTALLTAHLPTGAVAIQEAFKLAIETFQAEPDAETGTGCCARTKLRRRECRATA